MLKVKYVNCYSQNSLLVRNKPFLETFFASFQSCDQDNLSLVSHLMMMQFLHDREPSSSRDQFSSRDRSLQEEQSLYNTTGTGEERGDDTSSADE